MPALSQLSGDEFVTLVKSQSEKDTLTVVFVEQSLSVENLSQCKLKTTTCFENLRKIEGKTYLTAVEDPVNALESSVGKQKQKSISVSNDGELSEKVDSAGSEKLLFVYLDQAESKEDFAKHGEQRNSCHVTEFFLRSTLTFLITCRRADEQVVRVDCRATRKCHRHLHRSTSFVREYFVDREIAGRNEASN